MINRPVANLAGQKLNVETTDCRLLTAIMHSLKLNSPKPQYLVVLIPLVQHIVWKPS